jgi:GT2 family glycosyltransferase
MKKNKLISIIIVNWNGRKWLKNCFDSIYQQTYKNLEIILVDNNSSDNSVSYIRKNYPKIKIILNDKNYGFAKGNNLGLKVAKGDYYFLINNDTYIKDVDLISKLISFLEKKPEVSLVQPQIRLLENPQKIDVCGSFWTNTTLLYHFGYHKFIKYKKYNQSFPVFSVKGAAMLIRKDIVNKIGLFDEKFWCYYEETDFCHRVWLSGGECWYFPETYLLHAEGGTSINFDNYFLQYHSFKNKIRSFIKNFEGINLIIVLFKFFIISIIFILLNLAKLKFRVSLSIIKAWLWNIYFIKNTIRNKTHKIKKIPKKIIKNPHPLYYIYLFLGLEKYPEKLIK